MNMSLQMKTKIEIMIKINDEDGDKDGRLQMEDEDEYDAQDKDGDDGLPWARDGETERRNVSEIQRFMRKRRACGVRRSCLAIVASEPIDDRGREASDCGSRAGARDDDAAISACISSATKQNVWVAARHSNTWYHN